MGITADSMFGTGGDGWGPGLATMLLGGGTVGGPNQTQQSRELRDQVGMYNAQIMSATDPSAEAQKWSFLNPYSTPQAQRVNWMQAPVAQAQAAQGQAMQGRASTAQGSDLDLTQANQARANQNALVSSLQGTAAGQGPSVAQEQLRQATAANIAGQASAAQSAHGSGRLAALRNAQNNQAQIQQTANSQAAGLRAQEIAAAQGMLGGALSAQRSQDLGSAGQSAQLAQQSNQFNAQNQQQMALANLGYGNQMGLANLGFQQQAGLTNAGAANTAALNYAQQANAGNQALSLANLSVQQQANMLDLQRKQAMYGVAQQAMDSQSRDLSTLYSGQLGYEDYMRKNNQGLISGIGGIFAGGIGGGSLGGLF